MIIVVMGVSGSGKTTIGRLLADTAGFSFSDADDFHSPENKAKMASGAPLTDDDRMPWLEALQAAVKNWKTERRHKILACSALKREYRQMLLIDGDSVKCVYLRGSHADIQRRLDARTGHFMNPELLGSQFSILEEPHENEALIVDATLPPMQIVQRIREEFSI